MVTRVDQPPHPAMPHRRRGLPYERAWTAVALTVAVALAAIAIRQSPVLPLLGLVVGLGALGGLLSVRSPARSVQARRQYFTGALVVAAVVLAAVGMGHHPAVGLAAVGLLASFSPWTLRWV